MTLLRCTQCRKYTTVGKRCRYCTGLLREVSERRDWSKRKMLLIDRIRNILRGMRV